MSNEVRTRTAERSSASAGFTIIEILLVITIIGILAGVAAVATKGRGKQSRIAAARVDIDAISTALDAYEIDNGKYPSSLQGLLTSSGEPNWHGPYLKRTDQVPHDPWTNPYQYSVNDSGYSIVSYGPDGSSGGGDDITN